MRTLFLPLLLAPILLAADKPNIVYILADDLGYGDLSCYGQDKIQTPHIDSLAKDGMKFTNHYSGNTVCSPSRAVLMTGIESGRCYLRGNVPGEDQAALPEEITVLPEMLKNAGYRTGAFGKWGLGVTSKKGAESPHSHGFDEFLGWKSQLIAHTYYPSSYVHNGKEIPLDGKTYLHPLIMEAARDFIRVSAEADAPFFCYIPTAVPHAAMHAPQELHEKWRKEFPEHDNKIGTYKAGPDEETPNVKNPIAGFAAMMEHLDNEVGSVLALLKELELEENTIVLFASDNGAHKEGGHNPKFWNSTGGLRGHKRDMHEGGIRSPFLAKWPGRIAAGSSSQHLSGFHDLLPTFSDLVGESIPKQNTGLSFLPTLLNEDGQKTHEYLYIEFTTGEQQKLDSQALRFGDWKVYKKANKPLELYNLAKDPFERKNLAGQNAHKKQVKQAKIYLKEASHPIPKN